MSETAVGPARIAFFGGTFDPPHNGHLELARDVVDSHRLNRLFFIPARQNPHKPEASTATGVQRVAMLEAATANDDRLGVLAIEIAREEPSYTIDTVLSLEKRFPDPIQRYWLLGADQLPSLHRWHRIEDLAQRIRFLVLQRPGSPVAEPMVPGLRLEVVKTRLRDVSSTQIRESLAQGLPVDFCVPLPVLDYLKSHPHIYRKSC